MEERLVKVGVVGLGYGGRVHVPLLKGTPGVKVEAVADINLERAQRLAAKYGIPHVFEDYHELVQLPELDLVSVATPPNMHCEITLAAMEAGKHVLCEKPIAMDVGDSRTMLNEAKKRGALHFMNFEYRCSPAWRKVKQLYSEGYLGRLHQVQISSFSGTWLDTSLPWYQWWFRKESMGGWLAGLAPHYIDGIRYWFGEIKEVSAQLSTIVKQRHMEGFDDIQDVDADDTFNLLLKLENGASVVFSSSAVVETPVVPRLVAYGSDGTLVLEGDSEVVGAHIYGSRKGEKELVEIPNDEPPIDIGVPIDSRLLPNIPWFRAIADAVREGRKLTPDFEDGLRCQEVMDAAWRSAEEGRWVEIGS